MKRTLFRRLLLFVLALVCLTQLAIGVFAAGEGAPEVLTEAECEVIQTVGDLNIMRGDGTSFRPNDPITREELFRVVYSIAVGGETSAPNPYYAEKLGVVQGLTDVDAIAPWALPYAGYCFFNKLFVGDASGALQPNGAVSYFDCAKILLKLLGLPESAFAGKPQNIMFFGLDIGLFDALTVTDVYAPMTRLEVAQMITAALNSRCISSVVDNTLKYSTETGLRRWFRVSSVEKLRKSGVVTGKTLERGEPYLTVADGKETYLYPFSEELWKQTMGKIVCWSEKNTGELLSPMRLAADLYTSSLRELPPHRTENGSVVVNFGEHEMVFPNNLLGGKNVRIYNTATASFETDRSFLTVTALLNYLRDTLGERWGENTMVGMMMTDTDLVVRVTPRTYLRYDRAAHMVGSGSDWYPANDAFAAVPDGSFVAVLLDAAAEIVVLQDVLPVIDAGNGIFRAERDEMGDYSFFVNEMPVRNQTKLTQEYSDEELASYAVGNGKLVNYILCDGDCVVAAGIFDEYRLPYTDVSAYIFVERTEKVTIGSRNYTAIFGLINGEPGCELIDEAFGVPALGANRLLYLSVETTPAGESAVRPQGISTENDGLYGTVGFGRLTEAVFARGKGRNIKIGETELLLTDDCVVGCAEADGKPGNYRLDDLLVINGRGCDDQAGRTFRAMYGINADGAVEWLLLVRSAEN
ncbi:MAG: S-layer homology domain-containing protein [Ruminococcaceae bacterium]|nr:S-layer homology domain-containing protein [Oscillospiraceae bacterium]